MRAAHAIASSREGSSSTVKPPLSGGAHEYPPAENVPSAETSTGGTASSIPPPKTYTPAAFASSITACASRPTVSHWPSGTTIAALGKEIRYLAMMFLLGIDGGRAPIVHGPFVVRGPLSFQRLQCRWRIKIDPHVGKRACRNAGEHYGDQDSHDPSLKCRLTFELTGPRRQA